MALKGVKVLDLTRFQNGPFATCLLADVGADVVKIEQPGVGDTGRGFSSSGDGFPGYNESMNRGKRAIELDLKSPAARPVMEKLIQWADVLCENYKVGVLERLGYGYEACRKLNPRLVYCCNSGFGPEGPWSKNGCFDVVCQGFSGSAVAMGGGPSHIPGFIEWGMADQVGALNFAFHIAAALVSRATTGEGQLLECSQLGAMVQFQGITNTGSWYNGSQRDDGRPPVYDNVLLSYYPCGDGRWMTCAPCMEERHWRQFVKVLDLEDLLTDEKTLNNSRRFRNAKYFRERIEARLATQPRDFWVERLAAADVPVGPVLSYEEVKVHPQMRDNGYVVDVESQWGKVSVTGVAARYSGTPAPPTGLAPDLGEHTEEVLRGVCGFGDSEIDELVAKKATTPDPSTGYRPPQWMTKHRWKPHMQEKRSRL